MLQHGISSHGLWPGELINAADKICIWIIERSALNVFLCTVYKPCPEDAAYEISLYLDYWFTRRDVK